MKTVMQPQLPYIETVSRSFTPGNALKIYGIISLESHEFSINLQCSGEIESPSYIALKIVINVSEGNLSVNSMRRGAWDEAQNIRNVIFKQRKAFELTIVCDLAQYKISVNGRCICEFPQRISYDRVTHLVITGDVAVDRISYEMEPIASSHQHSSLITAPAPPSPDFRYTEGPPPYSDIQPRGYAQNVNYGACPIPMQSPGMPFAAGATFTPAIPGQKPYPIQEMYPLQSGTMIPLNAASSNFPSEGQSNIKKYIAYGCCICFAVVIFLAGLTESGRKNNRPQYRWRIV